MPDRKQAQKNRRGRVMLAKRTLSQIVAVVSETRGPVPIQKIRMGMPVAASMPIPPMASRTGPLTRPTAQMMSRASGVIAKTRNPTLSRARSGVVTKPAIL